MSGSRPAALICLLGLGAGPAVARDVLVEVEILHVAGRMKPAVLDALLADERLSIEADYRPTRLIAGETARRERIMPIGSKLFAIARSLTLTGAQIERQGRLLRFRLPHAHPEHSEYYRLNTLELRVPDATAQGRQRDLRFAVTLVPLPEGAHETARLVDLYSESKLGLRVRHRWSDAKGETVLDPLKCHADIRALGEGRYRFRASHRLAGEFRRLAPTVQSDPPSRPPAGQRSFRMRAPYPESMTGWEISRNHLVRLRVDSEEVERLSVYARQDGGGHCRRSRLYEALFAGGRPVQVTRSFDENECSGEGTRKHEWVDASWLEDGSLAAYAANTERGERLNWDGFRAASPGCGGGEAPPPAEVEALTEELQRLRAAFLRP